MARPRTGETPHLTVRVPEHIKRRAQERAREEGKSLSDVIIGYLHRYGQGQPRPPRR